ncbi:winged helix-turn-helix transcriptional regulator [Halobacterium zhouii]|uniref:winged helix-turn-helix transcriptional regulator n=1 Tax=Halobacterium zhouii TaxID=2902624 RepID=UPI001E3CAC83|nr:helix-turn-helix domain-containing protein [Halobacterium zhouii]
MNTASSASDCVASWCADDDWCGVTCTMEVLGRKWNPVVVHRLLERDSLRFGELAEELGDVTNKVLSESLEDLEDRGVVERTVENEKPVRVRYSLTERGRSLEPVVGALEDWGEDHLADDC